MTTIQISSIAFHETISRVAGLDLLGQVRDMFSNIGATIMLYGAGILVLVLLFGALLRFTHYDEAKGGRLMLDAFIGMVICFLLWGVLFPNATPLDVTSLFSTPTWYS